MKEIVIPKEKLFKMLTDKNFKIIVLNEEIERLNKENERLQNDYDIEHIQANYFIDLSDDLQQEIERLHSIIKEVREYINKYGILDLNGYDLLEILDKVNRPTVKPYKVEDNIQVGNVFFVGGE